MDERQTLQQAGDDLRKALDEAGSVLVHAARTIIEAVNGVTFDVQLTATMQAMEERLPAASVPSAEQSNESSSLQRGVEREI